MEHCEKGQGAMLPPLPISLTSLHFFICTPGQGWANLLARWPNSRLPGHGHWSIGYYSIDIIYATNVVEMYCKTLITIKPHQFVCITLADKFSCGRQVNKRQSAGNAFALLSTVGYVVLTKCAKYLAGRN